MCTSSSNRRTFLGISLHGDFQEINKIYQNPPIVKNINKSSGIKKLIGYNHQRAPASKIKTCSKNLSLLQHLKLWLRFSIQFNKVHKYAQVHRTIHITVKNAQKTLTRSDADSDTDAKGIRLAPLNFIPVSKKEKGKLLGKDSIHVHFVNVPPHCCMKYIHAKHNKEL